MDNRKYNKFMQLNNVFRDWLKNRKITDKVLEDFNIHGDECIVIPVYDIDGDFVFNKYRRSPLSDEKPKYWYDKGGKVTLYGSKQAKDLPCVLVTEGELDCITAWSQNIASVTSTGGSMSFQEEWRDFFSNKSVIICFDNDHAGGEGMVKALKIIPHAKILFIPDRPNMKDISDYVSQGGDLKTLIQQARHFTSLEEVKEDKLRRLATFQSTHFHNAYIKEFTKVNTHTERKAFSNDKVTNAKLYPITNLLEFTNNKTCCPFHREKTPSFNYYPKDNRCYCFGGCGRSYDAIDIYMNKYGVKFTEAVNKLNELL